MIDVYAFATPNSVKVPIALEELDIPYALHSVNIRQGEQKNPAFLGLNPNAKVPVIVDPDAEGGPVVLSESAAILVYLAEKTGRLLPASGAARARVFEQLFFHASGLGPAFGNTGFFTKFAPEPIPLAIDRFRTEGNRILGLLDSQLAKTVFVAGDSLTIADIAHFGWLWRRAFAGFDFDATPNLARWYAELEARPAFQRGIDKTNALAPS
jgi:hypothetical protein